MAMSTVQNNNNNNNNNNNMETNSRMTKDLITGLGQISAILPCIKYIMSYYVQRLQILLHYLCLFLLFPQ